MSRKYFWLILVLTTLLVACGGEAETVEVEVTRVVESTRVETIEVTRITEVEGEPVTEMVEVTRIVEVPVEEEEEAPTATYPPIVMWAKSGPEAEALKASAIVYNRETGNEVQVLVLGRAGFRQKYNTALAAGSDEVDGILDISRTTPSLAAAGFLEPLDEYIANSPDYNVDEIPESVQNEMKFDGQWVMAPTDISEESLVYRTDLIPEPPATWEELRENAFEFTQAHNQDSPTEYGYAYAASPGNLVGTWLGIQHGYGANIIDEEGCVVVDGPEAIAAFSFLIDMKNVDEVTPPDITAWDYPELLVGLQEGLVAQASFFTAGMPILTDCEQSPLVCENIAFVPQPAGPEGSYTRINPLGIMVNANSTRKDATWAFLNWLTGPEGAVWYTQFGGTSPRESVLTSPEVVAERPWLEAVYEASVNGVGNLRTAEASEVNDIFNKWADQAAAGDISPETALNEAAAELRSVLDTASNSVCQE